jgi:hypothetical protein
MMLIASFCFESSRWSSSSVILFLSASDYFCIGALFRFLFCCLRVQTFLGLHLVVSYPGPAIVWPFITNDLIQYFGVILLLKIFS